MAFSINGFGTTFYGERDLSPDGSFITTEWITAALLPIIPLRSLRVARSPENVNFVVYTSEGYYVLEKLPLCWPQVFATYSFLLAGLLWLAAILITLCKAPINWDTYAIPVVVLSLFAIAAPFFILLWLRSKKQNSHSRPAPPSPPPFPD